MFHPLTNVVEERSPVSLGLFQFITLLFIHKELVIRQGGAAQAGLRVEQDFAPGEQPQYFE